MHLIVPFALAGALVVPANALASDAAIAGARLAIVREEARGDDALDTATADPSRALKFVVAGGYAHFFQTDFDEGGGDMSVDRVFGSASLSGTPNDEYGWDFSVQWEGSWYSFADSGAIAGAAGGRPWDAVQSMVLSPGASFVLDERWRLSARVLLQFSGENDADAWDSMTYGGILAASYAFSPELFVGAGVLAASRIEDDALIVPQVIIDWRPCREFRLSNVAGPEAFPGGAGLEAIWTISEEYELAFGGRYTYRRFRLDDTGAVQRAEGVGTDEGLPIWLRATMRAKCGARLDLVAGLQMMGEVSLDDSNGNELASEDLEGAPFLGAFFSWRF